MTQCRDIIESRTKILFVLLMVIIIYWYIINDEILSKINIKLMNKSFKKELSRIFVMLLHSLATQISSLTFPGEPNELTHMVSSSRTRDLFFFKPATKCSKIESSKFIILHILSVQQLAIASTTLSGILLESCLQYSSMVSSMQCGDWRE